MNAGSAPDAETTARQHPRSFFPLHLAGVIVTVLIVLGFTARLWGQPPYIATLTVSGFLGAFIVAALCWNAGERWGMREFRQAGAARWTPSRRWRTLSTWLVASLFVLTVMCGSIPILWGVPGGGVVFEERPPFVQISAHVAFTGFQLCILAAGFHVLYFGVRPFNVRRRERLVTDRLQLSDETFAQRVSTEPELGRYVIAIRRVMATACRVAPGLIYDTDDPFELVAIMELDIRRWRGERLFVNYLGGELGLSLGLDFSLPPFLRWRLLRWKGGQSRDFGTWALEVARRLREYSRRQPPGPFANSGRNTPQRG